MNEDRPEALLKSALEKIVYFEARSEHLERDLVQVRSESDRLRADLASAAQREIDLRRVVAELEVRANRAHAEREEAARLVEGLRRERAELIGKMLDASRIQNAGDETPEQLDLAQFIATLREEVLVLRSQANGAAAQAPKVVVTALPEAPKPPSAVERMAASLEAQGRLSVQPKDLAQLTQAQSFGGRTEETLFGFSVRELSAPDAGARIRAAERLKALAHPAGAPALAAALHAETDPKVLEAFLVTFAQLAGKEGVAVVSPLVGSPSPQVRIAALKALLTLDATQASPHLAQAVQDPDAAVRRRASLLALSLRGAQALEVGAAALRDSNAEVRALAALVLGASGDVQARPLLERAVADADGSVRRAAAQSLSRLLGRDVTAVVDLQDSERRRAVRRLANVEAKPVLASAASAAPAPRRAQVAVVERAPVVDQGALLLSLRTAIRGRTLPELAELLRAPPEAVREACATLETQNRIVRRGQKFFVA